MDEVDIVSVEFIYWIRESNFCIYIVWDQLRVLWFSVIVLECYWAGLLKSMEVRFGFLTLESQITVKWGYLMEYFPDWNFNQVVAACLKLVSEAFLWEYLYFCPISFPFYCGLRYICSYSWDGTNYVLYAFDTNDIITSGMILSFLCLIHI